MFNENFPFSTQIYRRFYRDFFFFAILESFLITFEETTGKIENVSNKVPNRYILLSERNSCQDRSITPNTRQSVYRQNKYKKNTL